MEKGWVMDLEEKLHSLRNLDTGLRMKHRTAITVLMAFLISAMIETIRYR